MRNRKLDQYLKDIAEGRVSPVEAAEKLRMRLYDDMDFAKLDTDRELRTGRGEVVFALGKTPEQTASIMRRMVELACEDGRAPFTGEGGPFRPILATKATSEHYEAVFDLFGDGLTAKHGLALEYMEAAKMIVIRPDDGAASGRGSLAPGDARYASGLIAVVSGGTADMPVAEEAAVTAELYGHEVTRVYDVGISGLHRLLDKIDDIRKAEVVIAVAGMEGALASVIAGLVYRPVIAVPTSIGYGITLSGLTPLFAMLGSCSLGVGVMNVDNGFGAAHYASMILGVKDGR
ncbi:MAG: nickel pincer cofactor biosynthesis protein LarB [Clostridiales Family XIII bacterium]|jgi:NCAIR mutase (PurE)-related protein|nr:nickel pincer cofactor biosynthesis protein LarB [Clostridiales Family XIII bacterium]